MKKFIFLIITIFCGLQYSFAYTTVSGTSNSDATWSGTIFIESNFIIEGGGVITIEPGTVIKFAHDVGLTARYSGKIIADATYGSAIIFTSIDDNTVGEEILGSDGVPEAGDWDEIYLAMTNVYFEHVEIYYGAKYSSYNATAALHIVADTTLIRNCIISNSGYSGLNVNGNVKIELSHFLNSRVTGVRTDIAYKDSLIFNDCHFSYNGTGLEAYIKTGFVKVNNCTFENNTYTGLSISGNEGTECFIDNSTFNNNGDKAVYLYKVSIPEEFNNNTMENNGINGYYLTTIEETNILNLYPSGGIPFVIGSYVYPNTANIYAGTIIKIIDDALSVKETLNILGTESNPVIFTNINDDTYGGDTRNDDNTTSPESKIALGCSSIANIEYAKFYYCQASFGSDSKNLIKHSSFENYSTSSALHGKVTADSCYFANNRYGLSAYYDTCFITNCTFEKNDIGILNNRNVVVRGSLFRGNNYGLTSSYGYYTDLGKNSTDSMGNNIFTADTIYDIYLKNSYDVYAIGNTWDGSTDTEIDSKLYDDDEKSSLGKVIFTPWKTDCEFTALTKPSGLTSVCQNIDVNVYSTTNNDTDATVVWQIYPQTAGSLSGSGNDVRITWDKTYVGDVKLWAYPQKECGTGELTDTLIIQKVALPEKPIIVQNGNTLTTTTEYSSYRWLKYLTDDDYWEPIEGAINQSFTPSTNGTFAVEVKNSAGCSNMSDNYIFVANTVNTDKIGLVSIYPNPSNGQFTVNTSENGYYTITIYDITGRVIEQRQTLKQINCFDINSNGIYIIKIENSTVSKVSKVYVK